MGSYFLWSTSLHCEDPARPCQNLSEPVRSAVDRRFHVSSLSNWYDMDLRGPSPCVLVYLTIADPSVMLDGMCSGDFPPSSSSHIPLEETKIALR